MELKYEELVKDHWERLNSKLRMFSEGSHDFLDTWVPDEDHNRSIFGIFEAAANAKIENLSLLIQAETAKAVNEAWMKQKLELLGTPSIEKQKDRTVISLKFSKTKKGLKALVKTEESKKKTAKVTLEAAKANGLKSIPLVHEVHKEGIEEALKNIRYEGKAPAVAPDQELLEATDKGITLSVAVDPKGIVTAASHHGAKENAHRAILDRLCHELLNRPIQEGRDHGLIRVEHQFRNPSIKWPVQGLVTAENTSAAFQLPRQLIQKIFKDYVDRFHIKVDWNFWDDTPSGTWMRASKEQQMERAQEILKHAAQELGVDPKIVEVVDISHHTRIMIGYNPATIKLDFAAKMMKMEKIVKDNLEPRLELQLENLEDKNKRDSRTGRTTSQFTDIPLGDK